jgi:hypothetical protein
VRADANAGIVRHPVQLMLERETFPEQTRRVNALPSPVREDAFATHDDVSIALECEDGRDPTWSTRRRTSAASPWFRTAGRR